MIWSGRPNRMFAVVVGGVVLAGGLGWLGGTSVQSPADALAAHQAPMASLITVAVEHRALTSTVVTRGAVEFDSPEPLVVTGAVGSASSSDAAGTSSGGESGQRVTKAPAANQSLAEGAPVMEINGRPVFVLRGAVPMFRSIGPGREGKDVRQLQEALKRLGFNPGKVDGKYKDATAVAVRKWYQAKGYSSQEPSFAEKQQLRTLEQAVQGAKESQLSAKMGAAGATGPDKALLDLRLKNANSTLASARADLHDYQRQLGTMVPAGELIFLSALPVRMTEVKAKIGQTVDGPVGTVTSSALVVRANVAADDAELLRAGLKVEIETTGGGKIPGKVTALGAAARKAEAAKDTNDSADSSGGDKPDDNAAADNASGSGAVPLLITPQNPKALNSEAGGTVKLSVVVGSTADKVLVVPVAAVTTGADGQARLQVDRGGGRTEDVPVKVGLAALGYTQVTPGPGTSLRENDRVVVGTK